jgi:hypothetical protein
MKTVNLSVSEIKFKQESKNPVLSFSPGDNITIIINNNKLSGYIEVGDSHFRFNSAVYLPNEYSSENVSLEEVGSSGIVIIEQTLRILEYSTSKILITGHTDTVGSVDSNKTLSEYRAASFYSILADDRELFKQVSDAPHISDKNKKGSTLMNDKIQIANWAANEFGWSCRHKRNNYDFLQTFKAFQRSYNKWYCSKFSDAQPIAEDGDWGPKTWGAVFDCYQWALSKRLMIAKDKLPEYRQKINLSGRLLSDQKQYVGCSEYHPLENAHQDNYKSKTNRRVEVLFFDSEADIPALSCINNGACDGKQCSLFSLFDNVRGRTIQAEWEEPQLFANGMDTREMHINSQVVHPGDIITFTAYLLFDGGDIKEVGQPITATVIAGNAKAVFDERSDATRGLIPAEWCRPYSFFFIGRGPDFIVASPRLPHINDGPYYTEDIN